jgi:hypothetical protein
MAAFECRHVEVARSRCDDDAEAVAGAQSSNVPSTGQRAGAYARSRSLALLGLQRRKGQLLVHDDAGTVGLRCGKRRSCGERFV